MKLATRMHTHPRMVVHAYPGGRHLGNLLDLFVSCFSKRFRRFIIDHQAFPDDWPEKTAAAATAAPTVAGRSTWYWSRWERTVRTEVD